MAEMCPKGRCSGSGPSSPSYTGTDHVKDVPSGLLLDSFFYDVFAKLPDRGATGNTCKEKPLVVVQEPWTMLYLPENWWHFTYNLDDTLGVTTHVLPPRELSGGRSEKSRYTGPTKPKAKKRANVAAEKAPRAGAAAFSKSAPREP